MRKTYGKTTAVEDISFEVYEGEIFGLVGPERRRQDDDDGMCRRFTGESDRGAITVLGLDPFRDVYALQQRIGVQLQQAQLQKRIKVWEAIHLWAGALSAAGCRRRAVAHAAWASRRSVTRGS